MAQNSKPAEDLRVRRTRKLLMQSLVELVIEKGFSAITVQDIADRAMVNRATFYRHYLDKYDLLDHYMNDIYELTAAQEALPAADGYQPGAEGPPVGMVRMLERVWAHADFFRAMLGAKGDLAFAQRIRHYSDMRLRSLLPSDGATSDPIGPPIDLCLTYLSHAGVGVITWWLNEGRSYTPEQIAAWINRLNRATLGPVLDKTQVARP
jgi:AcrR family transcriptional regulator